MAEIARHQKKRYHPIIWIDYPIRIIGHTTVSCAVGATLFSQGNKSWIPYFLLVLQSFVYPQIALFFSMRSKNPRALEYNFLALDSFFIGGWVSYIDFAVLPSTAIVMGIVMSHFSMGGFPLAIKGWITLLLGVALVSVFHGIHFQPLSNFFVSSFTIFVLFIFACAMGYLTFRRAGELKETKGKLRSAYQEVESLNKILKSTSSSLELKAIMHQIYESFNLLLSFDFMTLQIVDINNNELRFRNYHGLTFTRKEADLYDMHVKLNLQSCLSVKSYTENETIYIPDALTFGQLSFLDRNIHEIIDFSSALYLPLVAQKEVIGVIGLYSRKKMVVNNSIVHSLKLQLSTIALILRNAILYEDSKKNAVPN